MNKVLIGSIIGTAALMASTGLALADSKGLEVKLGANASAEHYVQIGDVSGRLDVGIKGKEGHDMGDIGDKRGEKRDREMNQRDHEEKKDHATSTRRDHEGFDKGGIRAFLSFFFGLPASTTVGELRAEMTATSSANVSNSQGLGFWARVFGAFRLGHDN